MINAGAVDLATATDLDVVPCSPLKPELLQEEKIDEVCNEAFDELLTQEFNPDQDDFEDDVGLESDAVKDAGNLFLSFVVYVSCSSRLAVT